MSKQLFRVSGVELTSRACRRMTTTTSSTSRRRCCCGCLGSMWMPSSATRTTTTWPRSPCRR